MTFDDKKTPHIDKILAEQLLTSQLMLNYSTLDG
jgi:hypothetical protein